ncbi:MAG: general stress protein, partial [Actinomycetota bacterium]|nr:general stress protein [Actinomycetota bacterium]
MTENERAEKQGSGYTVIGVISDGVELNQAVTEIRDLGVGRDDLTVILKRRDMDEPEPFPEGTRYITVRDDRRGLEVPIGFAISFVLLGIFFAAIVPSIGIPTFMVFISLAAILVVGSFTRVGVSPILTEMEA